MKLAVVGTRKYKNKPHVYSQIMGLMKVYRGKITHIISGGGSYGPNQYALDYAREFGVRYILRETDWTDMSEPCKPNVNEYGEEYNVLAGFNNNTRIVEEADLIIIFWDGKSTNELDIISKARHMAKPLKIVRIDCHEKK